MKRAVRCVVGCFIRNEPKFVTLPPVWSIVMCELLLKTMFVITVTPLFTTRPSVPSVGGALLPPLPRLIVTLPRLLVPPLMTNKQLELTLAFGAFKLVASALSVAPLLVMKPVLPTVPLPEPPSTPEPMKSEPVMFRMPPAASVTTLLEVKPKLPATFTTPPLFKNRRLVPPGWFITMPVVLKPFVLMLSVPRLVMPPTVAAVIGKV